MKKTVKGKCDYITAINGLMFFIIIVGHCDYISGNWTSVSALILSVFMMFMPWFFYKSGSFSEHDGTLRTKHYRKKYIRPFVIYGAIGMAVQFLVTCFGYGVPFRQWLSSLFGWVCVPNTVFGNDPLWFLLTLFHPAEGASAHRRRTVFWLCLSSFPLCHTAYPLDSRQLFQWLVFLCTGLLYEETRKQELDSCPFFYGICRIFLFGGFYFPQALLFLFSSQHYWIWQQELSDCLLIVLFRNHRHESSFPLAVKTLFLPFLVLHRA